MHEILSWLIANDTWLEPLGVVVVLAGVVLSTIKFLGKFMWNGICNLWRKHRGKDLVPNTRITFVLNSRRTLWNMASRGGTIPSMQIMTSWRVTNASNVPVRILDAGLTTPNPRGRTCVVHVFMIDSQTHSAHGGMQVSIRPQQTMDVEATFFLDPPTQREGRPLKINMYLVDQYGRKHHAPRIGLQYRFPSAETY